jgi:hypothetical protein
MDHSGSMENVKEKCRQLRLDERKSLREIHAATGVPKGTLSNWLKDIPLSQEELSIRQKQRPRGHNKSKLRGSGESSALLPLITGEPSALQKARAAEAAVQLRLAAMNFEVYKGAFGGEGIDFIVCSPETGKLAKVQVKHTTTGTSGAPVIRLTRANGRGKQRRYDPNAFDIIVGYNIFHDTAYVYTNEDVGHLSRCVSATKEAHEAWWKLTTFLSN